MFFTFNILTLANQIKLQLLKLRRNTENRNITSAKEEPEAKAKFVKTKDYYKVDIVKKYVPSPIKLVLCWTSLLLSNAELQNNNIKEHETEHVARIGITLLIIFDFLAIIRHVYNMKSILVILIEQYSPPLYYMNQSVSVTTLA